MKATEEQKQYMKEYYKKNKKKFLAKRRKYYEENPELLRERERSYYQKDKKNRLKKMMDWQRKNPEKSKAHSAVTTAMLNGSLIRPDKCSNCSNTENIQAHHEDYSKPLDVVWLCPTCHRRHHAKD